MHHLIFRHRAAAWLLAAACASFTTTARAERLSAYPELASPFGINAVFDYSEEQAEMQRLDPPGVMAVVEGRDLPHVTEIGVRHYRVQPGEYAGFAMDRMTAGDTLDFSRTDALVTLAQHTGLNVLPVLAVYGDAAAAAEAGKAFLPRPLEAYRAWVQTVVERYDGDGVDDMPGLRFALREWQVEDTPDLLVQLRGGGFASTEDYLGLLQAAAQSIEAADEGATVVMGAVSSVDERDPGRTMLGAILSSPAGTHVDVVAFEHLPRTLTSTELRDTLKAVKEQAGTRPVWCTLAGSYSRYTPRNMMRDRSATEETQAADLVRRYSYMLANGVRRVYEAGMTEKGPDQWKDRTFYSGLRQNDGGPKPSYSSYRLIVRLFNLIDTDQSVALNDGQNDVVVLQMRYRGTDRLLYVLWWDYAATREYTLNQLEPDVATQVTLKLTDEVVEVGEMVQNAVGRFKTAVVKPRDGVLMLPIQRVPLMLRAQVADTAGASTGE